MYIPKILALFLSAVAGAASSDIHSPTLNTDEDVVSSPNLRSLATTEKRDLARILSRSLLVMMMALI